MTIAKEILDRDAFRVFAPTPASEAMRRRILDTTTELVGDLQGPAARAAVERSGLAKLHEHLPSNQLEPLRRKLKARLQTQLFQWACGVSRESLGFEDEFYLDEKIYFRINYPFEHAIRRHPEPAPRPGSTLKSRIRKALSLLDLREEPEDSHASHAPGAEPRPQLDLTTYNRGRPRPSWAHGPHIDTWYGHAYGSINLWWAIAGVEEGNSMVIFPESHKRSFPFDERNMYLREGVRTPPPSTLSLQDGELFVFDPELLHSTRINTTQSTRFVITVRVNPAVPTFSDETTHAIYDTWHKASDVSRGEIAPLRLGSRVRIEPHPAWRPTPISTRRFDFAFRAGTELNLGASDAFDATTVLVFENTELLLVRDGDEFVCTASRCPHVGLSLADGHVVDGAIQCPGHGARFSLKDGTSPCRALKLRVYPIREVDGELILG